jgi:phage terminase Nu1 subunit (DNA packaging protein)
VGDDLETFARDGKVHATTAVIVRRREDRLLDLRDRLADGWPRRKAVRAAIGHALELETWQSLVRRQELTRKQAVDAMLRFVASV